MARSTRVLHPLPLRLMHWLNAIAIIVLMMSGWTIHNAYPTLPFLIPSSLRLGTGLPDGLLWHFAAMWVLLANGVAYLVYGVISGRFRAKMWPIRPTEVIRDMTDALKGKLAHDDIDRYNGVQKLLYVGVIAAVILAVISGLAIWKPVQLQALTTLLGDFDNARLIHFAAMAAIFGFLVFHVTMALIVPKTLRAMVLGR